MTNGEQEERRLQVLAEALACPGAGPAGDARAPAFGERMRGIWASEQNPHRDGNYVRTVRRTGRFNPGTFYELTDGKGDFWQYPARSTVFISAAPSAASPTAPPNAPQAPLARMTDERIDEIYDQVKGKGWALDFARAIEAEARGTPLADAPGGTNADQA